MCLRRVCFIRIDTNNCLLDYSTAAKITTAIGIKLRWRRRTVEDEQEDVRVAL